MKRQSSPRLFTEVIAPVTTLDDAQTRRTVKREDELYVVATRATVDHTTGVLDLSPHLSHVRGPKQVRHYPGETMGILLAPNVRGYHIQAAVTRAGTHVTVNLDRTADVTDATSSRRDIAMLAAGELVTFFGHSVRYESSTTPAHGRRLTVPRPELSLCIDNPELGIAAWTDVAADELVVSGMHAALAVTRLRPEGSIKGTTTYKPYFPPAA